jgi:hypothetical protein
VRRFSAAFVSSFLFECLPLATKISAGYYWPNRVPCAQQKLKRRKSAALQGTAMSDLRLQLIERLCRLPEEHLTSVQELFANLESGPIASVLPQKRPGASGRVAADHKDWPHAPLHRLSEHGTFIVTASTHEKEHFFRGSDRLTLLENKLLCVAKQFDITLEAWAVFSNHYHFVAHTSGSKISLAR